MLKIARRLIATSLPCAALLAGLVVGVPPQEMRHGQPVAQHLDAGAVDATKVAARRMLLAQRLAAKDGVEKLKALGFQKVTETDAAHLELASTGSAISIKTPQIYYDTAVKMYQTSADYDWVYNAWGADINSSNVTNIGGTDAFAIGYSRQVVDYGSTLVFCPTFNGYGISCGWSDNLDYASAIGRGYKFQDRGQDINGGDEYSTPSFLNVDKGTIVHSFRLSTGGCLQVWSRYGHTWSSTSVSGVSFTYGAPSISFSSSSNAWSKASAYSGKTGCP